MQYFWQCFVWDKLDAVASVLRQIAGVDHKTSGGICHFLPKLDSLEKRIRSGLSGFYFQGNTICPSVDQQVDFMANVIAPEKQIVVQPPVKSVFQAFKHDHIFEQAASERMQCKLVQRQHT